MYHLSRFVARYGTSRIWLAPVLTFLLCCWAVSDSAAQVTLLIPSQPSLDAPPPPADGTGASQADTPAAPQASPVQTGAQTPAPSAPARPVTPAPLNLEVDVLITMMRPFQHQGLPMDMPQLFAVLRYDNATPSADGVLQPERRDLLGDVEEIRYLEQKAWGANVALDKAGLHHFIMEARPWWDGQRQRFIQQYVKATVPVLGIERGWNIPTGQRLEILPLTRPFGLTAPTIFSGRAVRHGHPLSGAPVRMHRINTDRQQVPSPWHQELAARADANGQFSFVLHQPGWWCCQVTEEGAPLKGPDGQPRPLEMSALFWLYVDAPLPPPAPQPEKGKR